MDKQKLINFISRLIPDDLEFNHVSMTFKDDYTAIITIDNKEDSEDEDEQAQYGHMMEG